MFSSRTVLDENAPAHPAISPADLAQIMAKKLAEGFTPTPSHRARVVENDIGFVPADFRAASQASTSDGAIDLSEHSPPQSPSTETAPPPEPVVAMPIMEPRRDFEAELRAAYDRGFEEGSKKGAEIGRAEAISNAELEVMQAKELFLSAAKALAEPQDAAVRDLSEAMLHAINRLTSERVGVAIGDHPEAFLQRVQRLADRVSQGVRQVTVHLNSEDLELVQLHLHALDVEFIKLVDSKKLGRGEIEIRGDGIKFQELYQATVEPRP